LPERERVKGEGERRVRLSLMEIESIPILDAPAFFQRLAVERES